MTRSAAQKATESLGRTIMVHVRRVRFQRECLHQLSLSGAPANPAKYAKENPGHEETGAAEDKEKSAHVVSSM